MEYLVKLQESITSGDWEGFYDFGDGVGHRIVFFIFEGIFFFIILLLIDYEVFRAFSYYLKSGIKATGINSYVDPDVGEHAQMINSTDINDLKETYDVVLKNVSKEYKDSKVVNDVNLVVEKGECFGFLGANGAGKTTTFKMTLGDISMGGGEIYLYGRSMKACRFKRCNYVGYCPQDDGVLPEMTVGETLYMYALFRGIPVRYIGDAVYELADAMLFAEYLNRKIEKCSGGTKRKVSAAIGILGNPPLIFLDEPTTGIDPEAKRKMWDLLSAIRESGSCIILCSHSMDECEALCTRLTIMVHGQMRCLGSIQHLKSTFSRDYTLMIKGKKQIVEGARSESSFGYTVPTYYVPADPCRMDLIKQFVDTNFPGIIIIWLYCTNLLCTSRSLPDGSHQTVCGDQFPRELSERRKTLFVVFGVRTEMPLSKMFGLMEKAKKTIIFEDYSLGQSTLEEVFLLLTKEQTGMQE
ncbi:hypothetical protein L9F63_013186, partial [Diploptera punctata]